MTKLFTAEDFGDDILDAEDIQTVAADAANARLAPLVEAVEYMLAHYPEPVADGHEGACDSLHNAIDGCNCPYGKLTTAYRALRDREPQ